MLQEMSYNEKQQQNVPLSEGHHPCDNALNIFLQGAHYLGDEL